MRVPLYILLYLEFSIYNFYCKIQWLVCILYFFLNTVETG